MARTLYAPSPQPPVPGATPLINNLPHMTVVCKGGLSFCANHISVCIQDGRYCLAFISSGVMQAIPADRIERIAYFETGRTWCDQCDAPINTWPEHCPPAWIADRPLCAE